MIEVSNNVKEHNYGKIRKSKAPGENPSTNEQ